MTCGIYKITNILNDKMYIGQSVNIENRWKSHISSSHSCTDNNKFYNSMKKYGIDNFTFEIITVCKKEDLNKSESFWITVYDSINNGFNSCTGGANTTYSLEVCEKVSKSKMNNKHFLGHKHSDETKARMSKNSGKRKVIVVDGITYDSIIDYGRKHNLLKNRARRYLKKLGLL